MKMVRLAVIAVLMLGVSFLTPAAPAPVPKPKPKEDPAPVAGLQTLEWGGTDYDMTLDKNGSYVATRGADTTVWLGSWQWDAKTRKFAVQETCNQGQSWLKWEVTLDAKTMEGDATGDVSLRIGVKPWKVPVNPQPGG